MDSLNSFVSTYPGTVVLIFGFLVAISKIGGGALVWFVRRELKRLWDSEAAQDKKLEKIEGDLGSDTSDIKLIKEQLGKHISDEEEMWKTVDRIDKTVTQIETKMPNGDLRTAISKLNEVSQDLKDHNKEAEGWKRTITAHGVRLDTLERGKR